MSKRRNIVDEVMNEIINYGGIAARRGDAYLHALACAKAKGADKRSAPRCADYATMMKQAISSEEAACLIPWAEAKQRGLI